MANSIIKISLVHLTQVNTSGWIQIESDLKRWSVPIAIDGDSSSLINRSSLLGRWLVCRLLLSFGVTESKLNKLAVTDLGKPYLSNSGVFFSVSHSAGYVACAATQGGRIGIDLELIRPIQFAEYKDCFTADEWRDIQSAASQQRRFLEKWTEKESLLKADGRGVQVSMADVITSGDLTGRLVDDETDWMFHRVPGNDYMCTICVDFRNASVLIHPITTAT